MPKLRSATVTEGRNRSGARALWRATGVKDSDFGKPIVAVVNSFSEFVPGHVHLRDVGQIVAKSIQAHGGIAKEFNSIAIDDGIAMGHGGMLYSLPSRDLIADSVEYVVNAHCADAMVCISNCDKITPGMFMAAMRLNIPVVFVSGGPMEAGKTQLSKDIIKLDLVDAMVSGADPTVSESHNSEIEKSACPTCGSCSGMFTANSMNCLLEALGLALPGNGSLLATHKRRYGLFEKAGETIMSLCRKYYQNDDNTALPRVIASKDAFENAMTLDIAMGGSTNTVLHLLAAAYEAEIPFSMADIDRLSRHVPHLCKVAPATPKYHMEDVHRAGGIAAILGELEKANLLNKDVHHVCFSSLDEWLECWDITRTREDDVKQFYRSGPAGVRTTRGFSQECYYPSLDVDRQSGCIRKAEHCYSKDGGLAVLKGNLAPNGCVVKTAAVAPEMMSFTGRARVFDSQEAAVSAILNHDIQPGHVVVIRYEGPAGGPGMQEMLHPTSYLKSMKLDTQCALITDGRFSGGTAGLSIGHISPEAAAGGAIALLEDDDIVDIDIPARSLSLRVDKDTLLKRKKALLEQNDGVWRSKSRTRDVSRALKAYAHFASSADKGAVRILPNEVKN